MIKKLVIPDFDLNVSGTEAETVTFLVEGTEAVILFAAEGLRASKSNFSERWSVDGGEYLVPNDGVWAPMDCPWEVGLNMKALITYIAQKELGVKKVFLTAEEASKKRTFKKYQAEVLHA